MAGRAYGKTVWSWPSLLRSSPAKMRASPTGQTASSNSRGEGGQRKVRLPGEHGISRPTIAQGRPSDRRHLYAAVRFSACAFRAADRGCLSAPGLPCALLDFRGWSDEAKLGRFQPRGRKGVSASEMQTEKRCRLLILRHCERSDLSAVALTKAEAIQNPSAEGLWIASSQGLLAMTSREYAHPTPLSCPGRSAALLRCAAEPGPISPRAVSPWVPALRSNASRCSASGTRERSPNSTPACCPGCPGKTPARRSRSVRHLR